MKYTIKAPRQLNASINLPASKSISNRALVINAMAGCKLQPHNLSDCDDTEVIIAALRDMPDVINIKAAGTGHALYDRLSFCYTGRAYHHRYRAHAEPPYCYSGRCPSLPRS